MAHVRHTHTHTYTKSLTFSAVRSFYRQIRLLKSEFTRNIAFGAMIDENEYQISHTHTHTHSHPHMHMGTDKELQLHITT